MRSATQTLYPFAGGVPPEGAQTFEGPCWLCGGTDAHEGVPQPKWQGSSFTGQSRIKAPHGTHVCVPCVFFTSRTSPVPGRPPKPGKKFGGNFRNYSHLLDGERYANASKGEKPAILAFLRGPKSGTWFAAIADSGQKHVLPWVPLNPPGARGRVLFDETVVALPGAGGWCLVDDMIALLTAGATKDEISRGDYGVRAWSLCRPHIHAFEAAHAALRGGGWFDLALWLAQRDEDAVQARIEDEKVARAAKKKRREKAPRGDADGRRRGEGGEAGGGRRGARGVPRPRRAVPARDAGGVPEGGREPAQALGADSDQGAARRADDGGARGVVHDGAAGAGAAGGRQLGLFGDDGAV